MCASLSPPRITIFAPDPLLSITIERRGDGRGDEIHVHPGGQGVWIARMAAELGAHPILCGLLGGETGGVLSPLLEDMAGERRTTVTAGASGSYVIDRRDGERRLVASMLRPAPVRHELDDLVEATCSSLLRSELLVLANPFPAEGVPEEIYDEIAAAAHEAGIPTLVDLSSPRLDRVLRFEPDLVKLNDWELAEYVEGPVDGSLGLQAAGRLRDAGARSVAVTAGESPILVLPAEGEPFEIAPPPLPLGFREGCGDTMMGAVAAAWARGLGLRQSLVLGAAAGATNFLRRGLGTGRRAVVEEMAAEVSIRPLVKTEA